MDLISLDNFKNEINQVREYLKHIHYISDVTSYIFSETDNEQIKILLNTLKEHYKSFGTSKKIFEYNATIISLYGLLEKYVELWIKEYLESLSTLIPEYNKINEKIRVNHFNLSLKLINTITTRESSKYQHITKEQVLEKLNNCIVNPTNYAINTEAFVILSGNLKHDKIVELFKLLDIDLNSGLIRNESLNDQIGLPPDKIAITEKGILYNKIDDLVERRNQIAHGSVTLDILGSSGLDPYIQFLEIYCQAVFETLDEEFIKQESVHTFQKIEVIRNVWRNSILGFEIENYTIKVGDMLIIETPEGKFHKRPIIEIELDGKKYPELKVIKKTNIAIEVEPKIKHNQTFYIAKK